MSGATPDSGALMIDDTTDGTAGGPPQAAAALDPQAPPFHPTPSSRRGSERNPTEVTDEYEVYAHAPPSLVPLQVKYGKWLVFRKIDQLDETWHVIRRAVESAELGCSEASCSTLKYNPSKTGGGAHDKGVIRVFTSEEKADEVGTNLCRLVRHDVSYKTEEASKKGEYKHRKRDKNERITCKTVFWNGGDPALECKHGQHTPWSQVYRPDPSSPFATSSESRAVIQQKSLEQKQARPPGYVEGEPCFGRWKVVVGSDHVSDVWHMIKHHVEIGRLPAKKAECTEEMPAILVYTSEEMVDKVGEKLLQDVIGTNVMIKHEIVDINCTPELRSKHSKALVLSPETKLVYRPLQQAGTGNRENWRSDERESGGKKSEPKEEEGEKGKKEKEEEEEKKEKEEEEEEEEGEEKEKEEKEEKEEVGAAFGGRQNETLEDEELEEVVIMKGQRRESQTQERQPPADWDGQGREERQKRRSEEENQRGRSDCPESQSQPNADKERVRLQLLFPFTVPIPSETGHTRFIDPVETIHCDSSGGIYHNPLHGITLRIPEEAIPHGEHLKISVGVCLCGDFSFTNDHSPASAIVWLCSKTDPEMVFSKPIEVIIPHFMECKSEVDAESLEMQFMKASHRSSASGATQFSLADGEADFTSVPNKGVLRTRHFCYLCITTGNSPEQLKSRRFCIACARPQSITTGSDVYFYVLYFLDTCIQSVEQQLVTKYILQELRAFSFSNVLPGETAITGEYQCSATVHVTLTLQPTSISQNMTDFWKLHKNGELELMEKMRMYPPSMKLTFGDLSSCEEQVITVLFRGTQEPEEQMKIEIIIPSSKGTSSSTPASPVQRRAMSMPALEDKPTIRQLYQLKTELKELPIRIIDKLAPRWKVLAVVINFDPEARHIELIEKKCGSEGAVACCREVLTDWLRGRGSLPPTWENLLEILKDIEENNLAIELHNLLSHKQDSH